MEIDRKQIMETLIGIIGHISDKEYQKRIWIRGEGPEVDDFDETCCIFFPEVEDVIENYKDFSVTEPQYKILKQFHDEFEVFADNNNFPEEFIDTPEWARIMDLAREVLKVFGYPQKRLRIFFSSVKGCFRVLRERLFRKG